MSVERNQFECPVCLEIMTPPIFQCHNGHLICSTCIDAISLCPICRERMPDKKTRNLVLEDLVRNMDFDCKNKHKGCTARMKQKDFKEHGLDCSYQALPYCQLLGLNCTEETLKSQLIEHLKREHPDISGFSNKSRLEIEQELEGSENNVVIWSPHYLQAYDQLFFLTSSMKQPLEQMTWQCKYTGSSKSANNFIARIEIVNMNANADSTIIWRGNPIPLHSQEPTLILPKLLLKQYASSSTSTPPRTKWKLIISVTKLNTKDVDALMFGELDLEPKEMKRQLELNPTPTLKSKILYNTLSSTIYTARGEDKPDLDPSKILYGGSTSSYHPGLLCDNCRSTIEGVRYKCQACMDYDLCFGCEQKGAHPEHSSYVKISFDHQQKQKFEIYERPRKKK